MSIGRRSLLQGSLRYAALAGLATLAAVLWKKHRDLGPECRNAGLCQRCKIVEDCRLPLALNYKKK